MQRAKAAMGFRSVKRVEVKAETTTPGEVRTTTDANGVRVSASRARRTLPKLEFVVEENGAILHGPQRGLFPYYAAAAAASGNSSANEYETTASGVEDTGRTTTTAMAAPRRSNQERDDALGAAPMVDDEGEMMMTGQSLPLPMKDCVLNDSRATTLAVKFDPSRGKFVCGSSIERFSGHTGVCRVLGSKKYPIIPHNLQIGDLLRIGSVGLVVCELNRGPSDANLESLTEDEYQYIKENYLSLPLQQTFRPTDSMGRSNQHGEDEDEEEDDDEEEEDDHDRGTNQADGRMRRQPKMRSGETSDEGESEEDGVKRSDENEDDDEHDDEHDGHEQRGNNGSGSNRKKTQRAKNKEALLGSKEKRFCYICYDTDEEPEENPLVAPCNCKGDTKYVHLECLQRWNNNLDADGSNPNHKMCAVTNTDGLDVCSICKATYMTSVKLDDGRVVSLMAKKLPPPYVTFAVVTQHEARSRSTTLTNTRFQLSFSNIPRGQQFLTIGRSTTNNMTLRYRTVSQLHAKVKFEDNNFYIYDASSSNGTMLFLSKPLELDWNKTAHVKIGRTILTLKSKKRWKWSGGGEFDDEGLSSPRAAALESNQTITEDDQTTDGHRVGGGTPVLVNDPSAELLSSPYAAALRQPLNRTFSIPHPPSGHQISRANVPSTELASDLDTLRLSELVNEGTFLTSNHSGYTGTPRRSFGTSSRAYPELPATAFAGSNIPRITSRFAERQERRLAEFTDRLSQMALESPSATNRLSAPGRFERS